MPTYTKGGERVTVEAGSLEDKRLGADGSGWAAADAEQPGQTGRAPRAPRRTTTSGGDEPEKTEG